MARTETVGTLQNAAGTQMQWNDSSLGAGIYFSRVSNTSWGYSHMSPNGYARSVFGGNLHIIWPRFESSAIMDEHTHSPTRLRALCGSC